MSGFHLKLLITAACDRMNRYAERQSNDAEAFWAVEYEFAQLLHSAMQSNEQHRSNQLHSHSEISLRLLSGAEICSTT